MFGGSGGKGEPQLVAPQAADDRFSLVELRRIYKQLVENKVVNTENQDLVIEILRVIAEMVVYGDNKSELLFDFFCEKSMLSLFLEIMNSKPTCPFAVHVQILQTLSILISCVKNDTSLYYLLSNNHINDILVFKHDFDSDESLSAQFASFMKTLSLRLNDQTVQFFFREDSGAFPLLTKAVELLANKDPMIRISAQSTILNIFRVNEQRALAYALQEENLFVLLECIVGIMSDQVDTLHKLSQSYLQALQAQQNSAPSSSSSSSADTGLSMTKVEQNMDDCIISIEDWIYYLQDVYDLNIPQLQQSLSTHLLNAFVYPTLLESMLVLQPARDSTPSDADATSSQASRVDIAMFYLLQLGRIFPSQALRRAIITALAHPVSQESRSVMTMHLHLSGDASQLQLPEDIALKANLFKQGMRSCLLQSASEFHSSHHNQQYQKFVTLTTYAIHGIVQALFQDFKNNDLANGALKLETFLIATDFLHFHPLVNTLRSSTTHSLSIVGGDEDVMAEHSHSGDFLTLSELILLRQPLLNMSSASSSAAGLDLEALVQRFAYIVQHPQQFSIANLQAACQLLAFLCHVVICAGDVSGTIKNTDATNSNDAAANNGNENSAVAAAAEEGNDTPVNDATDANYNNNNNTNKFRCTTAERLQPLAEMLQAAMRSAASTLLARAESSFAEMLLILIREEIDRFQGRIWKELHSKMFSEKGLIFPHLPQSHADVMGLDFIIPVSHVETMRKEVQVFLMLRAVMHYLATSLASFGDSKMLPFEFSTFLADCSFLSLEDESIVPGHLKPGNPFDMKGKKFLDSTTLVPSVGEEVANVGKSPQATGRGSSGSSNGSNSPIVSSAIASSANTNGSSNNNAGGSSSSIFSFGLFGKSSSSSNGTGTKSSATSTNSTSSLAGMTLGPKLLFVQDSQVLQLISATKVDGKSVFKVSIVAPLLYVDAKLDMQNKKRLKLFVRSYKSSIPGMRKVDVASTGDENQGQPSPSSSSAHNSSSNNTNNNNNHNNSQHSLSLVASHLMMSSSSGHNPVFLLAASSNNNNNNNNNSSNGSANAGANSPVHGQQTQQPCGFRPTVFLKPVRKAGMFELDLLMDTEQAASLAMQHVEQKRRQLQQLKIEECKKKLQYWLSDRRHWTDCIPNSES